jgi:dCTP diphosphatase
MGERGIKMAESMTVKQLQEEALKFRDERNWKQYHDPKNLAAALSIEAAELQELFLWKSKDEVQKLTSLENGKEKIGEELADIFIYLIYLADSVGVDLTDAAVKKITINKQRYPVDKSYSSNKKYTDFD